MYPDEPLSRNERLYGLARVAAAGLIWGTIPLVLRAADGASVVKVFYRVVFAAMVIGGAMLVRGSWRELTGLPALKWRQLITQGLVLTLNWYLFLTALDITSVATAELLGYTGPVFVAAFAPFVTKEPFDRRTVLPLGIALTGIVVILAPHGLEVTTTAEKLGAALAFFSALTYATLLLRSKKILRGVSSSALMLVEYGVASLVLSPFVIAAYRAGNGPSEPGSYAALVTLGIVHTALAGFIFLGGIRRVRTDHAAIMTYIEPVSAVVFASLFLGEALTFPTILGGAMVVIGGILVTRIEARESVPIEALAAEEEPDDSDGEGKRPTSPGGAYTE